MKKIDDCSLLNAVEVANLLSVSRSTVLRWTKRGSIPDPISIGRLKRWKRSDLMKWIDNDCKIKGLTNEQ